MRSDWLPVWWLKIASALHPFLWISEKILSIYTRDMICTSNGKHRQKLCIPKKQQQRSLGYSEPIALGLISHFCSPLLDISLHCEFPVSGIVNRGNASVVAAVQSCSSFLPTRAGMVKRSRPQQRCVNFFLTRITHWLKCPQGDLNPGRRPLRFQLSTTGPPRHNNTSSQIHEAHVATYC